MKEQKSLEHRIQKQIQECLDVATMHYRHVFTLDKLMFNLRGKAAGQFVAKRIAGRFVTEIRINQFMLQQNREDFISEVVPHECAHLVVFELWGKSSKKLNKRVRPHGPEWKEVMRLFGKDPKVRHEFLADVKETNKYHYICGCPGKVHELTVIRHNKITRRGVRYQCKKCLDVLLPKNEL